MPHVNLIGWDNGVGLSRDLRLIEQVLREAGFKVSLQPARGRGKLRKWLGPWWQRARLTTRRFMGRKRFALNIIVGDWNLLDENDNIIAVENWRTMLNRYADYCAAAGIEAMP